MFLSSISFVSSITEVVCVLGCIFPCACVVAVVFVFTCVLGCVFFIFGWLSNLIPQEPNIKAQALIHPIPIILFVLFILPPFYYSTFLLCINSILIAFLYDCHNTACINLCQYFSPKILFFHQTIQIISPYEKIIHIIIS